MSEDNLEDRTKAETTIIRKCPWKIWTETISGNVSDNPNFLFRGCYPCYGYGIKNNGEECKPYYTYLKTIN